MHWDYRVIKNYRQEEEVFSIHEVYYEEDGQIKAYTENPIQITGESVEDLKITLERITRAFNLPVLDK